MRIACVLTCTNNALAGALTMRLVGAMGGRGSGLSNFDI